MAGVQLVDLESRGESTAVSTSPVPSPHAPPAVPKLFGATVVHGLSSENRVFATLLAARDGRYDALVAVHDHGGTEANSAAFAAMSNASTVSLDTGWRPNLSSRRVSPTRARVAVRYLRNIRKIIGEAAAYRPDVVYSSQQHYDCRAASSTASRLGVPQIVHLHYTVGPWLRPVVLDKLKSTDHVVAVSDFIRRQAIAHGVVEDRVTTIHNTVPAFVPPVLERTQAVRAELGIGDDSYVYGTVGRLDEGKGHLDAIAAFERVASSRHDAVLVIVGSGRIEGRIRSRAAGSPAASRILLTGQRPDVPDLLAVFDVLVHPATADPCPLAVLEAMAAGLPVLAYDDGGLPEMIDTTVTGLLVAHGRVDELADAMSALYDQPEMGRGLGAAAACSLRADRTPEQAGRRFAEIVASLA